MSVTRKKSREKNKGVIDIEQTKYKLAIGYKNFY